MLKPKLPMYPFTNGATIIMSDSDLIDLIRENMGNDVAQLLSERLDAAKPMRLDIREKLQSIQRELWSAEDDLQEILDSEEDLYG